MNMRDKFPELCSLLGSYFHQDCYYDGETSEKIVNDYMQDTVDNIKLKLIVEITEFLKIYEDELKVIDEYPIAYILYRAGADCIPMPHGVSAFDWLMMIKMRLIKETMKQPVAKKLGEDILLD